MRKTLLEKIEIDKLDSNYKELFESDSKLLWLISSKKIIYLDEKGIIITLYYKNDLLSNKFVPKARVFFLNNTYITEVFYPEGKKWSSATLGNLFYYTYDDTVKIIDKQSEDIINKYFAKKGYKSESNNKMMFNIHKYQDDIVAKKRLSRHKKELNDIDRYMSKFRKLPRNFKKWIDKKAFYDSAYIYYKYVPNKKKLEGYCTWCKKDLLVQGAKHNTNGICPKCKHPITYKAEGKSKNVSDSKYVEVFELSKDNLLLSRIIKVTKLYKLHYRDPIYHYYEFKRVVYDNGKTKWFEMAEFKQNMGVRWCYDSHRYWNYTTLYDDNLDILDNTEFKYSGFIEYRDYIKDNNFITQNYFYTYRKYPFIEHLVKNQLFNFVDDLLIHNCDIEKYIDPSKSSLREILQINKEELRFFKEIGIGFSQYATYMKFKNVGVTLTQSELNYFTNNSYRLESFIEILKYGTFKKCYKYLLSSIEKHKDNYILSTWKDYVHFCEKLNLDLTKKSILYPSDLIKQHDELNYIIIENTNSKYDKAISEIYYELENKYSFNYKNLQIVIPKYAKDIIREGKSLHHCVGSYVEKVAKRYCDIVFIRKSDSLNKSYYTVEIKNGKVVQCKGLSNTDYRKNEEVNNFVNLFEKHFSKKESLGRIS